MIRGLPGKNAGRVRARYLACRSDEVAADQPTMNRTVLPAKWLAASKDGVGVAGTGVGVAGRGVGVGCPGTSVGVGDGVAVGAGIGVAVGSLPHAATRNATTSESITVLNSLILVTTKTSYPTGSDITFSNPRSNAVRILPHTRVLVSNQGYFSTDDVPRPSTSSSWDS